MLSDRIVLLFVYPEWKWFVLLFVYPEWFVYSPAPAQFMEQLKLVPPAGPEGV
jgi:hypothetical protein